MGSASHHRSLFALALLLGVLALPGLLPKQGLPPKRSRPWGDLRLRFTLDKTVTVPSYRTRLTYEGRIEFDDEPALGTNRELANVMVWLVPDDPEATPIHPETAKSAAETKPTMRAKDGFLPRCLIASAGQTIVFESDEPIGHSFLPDLQANRKISRVIPAANHEEWPVRKPEKRPAPVSCSVHPWELAWIMVAPVPYHGVSDRAGVVTLRNLPAGQWKFRIWCEHIGFVSNVEIDGQRVDWPRGVAPLTIQEGKTTSHDIKVLPRHGTPGDKRAAPQANDATSYRGKPPPPMTSTRDASILTGRIESPCPLPTLKPVEVRDANPLSNLDPGRAVRSSDLGPVDHRGKRC